MTNDPTYEELAERIAREVYQNLDMGPPYFGEHRMVDDMGTSSWEFATGVLERLDLLYSSDGQSQIYEFTCEPDEFAEVIARNKQKGCSYDTLMASVLCLAQMDRHGVRWLRDYCAEIGLTCPVSSDHV